MIAPVSEDGDEHAGSERLSEDLRSWWTGQEWVPPIYEIPGL